VTPVSSSYGNVLCVSDLDVRLMPSDNESSAGRVDERMPLYGASVCEPDEEKD
jgi:hypothetical protein